VATKKSAAKKSVAKKAVKTAAKKTVKKSPLKKAAKKKAAPKKSNLERLMAADVISAENAGEHDAATLNKLSSAEVNSLIKIRKKMGAAPLSIQAGSRPNFPV
jgi:hypothetical protein